MKSRDLAPTPIGKEHVNLRCEVCGGAHSSLIRTLYYPQFGHPGSFELRQCEDCGLVFNSPRLDAAALGRLYDRNYYVFNELMPAAFDRVVGLHHATVAQLEARVGAEPRRLLEVGSAKGYMLALMGDRGWRAQGIELSEHAARFATAVLQTDTFCGTLESWIERPDHEPCALVYCTDVIEHVPSPQRFVEALRRSVAPGGLVLIGTPNIESDGVRQHGDHWLGFNPFHVWLYSRKTLGALLERFDFEVIESYTFGNDELAREPETSVVRRWLRDGLARMGVLASLRSMRAGREVAPSAQVVAALRKAAGHALTEAPSWRTTPDGRHARATACRGDNLVVIARRRTKPNQSV